MAREPLAEISALATECFRHLVAAPHVVVRVNDALQSAARDALEAAAQASDSRLVVLAEPDIAPGDCRIEWADGGIKRDSTAIEAAIDEAVARYVANRSGETYIPNVAWNNPQPGTRTSIPTNGTLATHGGTQRRTRGGAQRREWPRQRRPPDAQCFVEELMSDTENRLPLPDLENNGMAPPPDPASFARDLDSTNRGAADLEAVFDVPVKVSAVLGRARMEVGDLLRLGPGAVLELDRKVGEAIDLYVNDRLVARGEVVLVEDKLGVTMTEIIKADRS